VLDVHSSAGNLQKVSVFSATEATDDFFSTLHSKPRLAVMGLLHLCSERLVFFFAAENVSNENCMDETCTSCSLRVFS